MILGYTGYISQLVYRYILIRIFMDIFQSAGYTAIFIIRFDLSRFKKLSYQLVQYTLRFDDGMPGYLIIIGNIL